MRKLLFVYFSVPCLLFFACCSLGAEKPMLILEPHSSTAVKSYMNSQKLDMAIVIGAYLQAASSLPDFCRAKRFIEKSNHVDSIPGNNQDIALVLIQSLSLDLDKMIDSYVDNDPNDSLKLKGILLAAKAHDSLLEGLNQTEKIMGKITGTMN